MAGMFLGVINPSVEPFAPDEAAFSGYDGPVLTIAGTGAGDYVIIKGADASPSENAAAEKLRGYLEQICGVSLEIRDDSGTPQEKEIIVGKTNREGDDFTVDRDDLGEEGFIIKTVGDKIVIAGGEMRGTLYGIFDFLEKYLGCRWLSAEHIIIPENAEIKVPAQIDEREVPYYYYRDCAIVRPMTSINTDYALANRMNGRHFKPDDLSLPENGGSVDFDTGHYSGIILPVEEYYDEHPEYFAMDGDGNRRSGYTNPCMSNEEVIRIFCDYAVNRAAETPVCVAIGLNDCEDTCLCEKCAEIYNEENGATTATIARLLNRVCEAVADAGYEDTRVSIFAYKTTFPPPMTKLHKNAQIYYCPIYMCYVHTPGECTQEYTNWAKDEVLQGWREVCDNIVIYDYPLTYDHYGIAYPIWNSLQPYLQYYYENGAIGLITCTNSVNDVNFYVMLSYLYARLLWNPYTDIEELCSNYMPYYYGDGWQYIREYMRAASEEYSGRTICGKQFHTRYDDGATSTGMMSLSNKEIAYCDGLWAKAKSMATEDWQLVNIRRAELSYRIWKSGNMRGEFSPFKLRSRFRNNKLLFDDIWELDCTQHNQTEYGYVTPEEFYSLKIYHMPPQYWNWRQLGRNNQGKVSNFREMLWGTIFG